MAGWHDPRPTDHHNPVEEQRWRSLEAFLRDPTFNSITLQDEDQRVYNPATGTVIPAPEVPITGGGGGSGTPGPPGPAGPTGPAGPGVAVGGTAGQVLTKNSNVDYDTSWQTGGGGGNYRHVQSTAAATWTIAHNLGYYPNITTVDSSRREVIGEIDYIDTNTVRATFSAAFGGEAYAS